MTTALQPPPTTTSRTPAPTAGPYRFTRAEYHRMGELGFFEGKRVELIRGEIYQMSPISWSHARSLASTLEVLGKVFEGRGWISPQNPLVTDDSEPEPDVAIYRGTFRDYFGHPTPVDTLLVIEIAVTSLVKDTTIKADFYSQESIADYWVVDVEHRKLIVFRKPSATGYQSKQTLGDSDTIAPLALPNASIRVADLLP